MCNAWNHRPGCDCGWGGEGHMGGGGYRWDAKATWVGGYDLNTPNANCPVCAERVFFIRPRNGGCGWFDAMGVPWPKHPCMESAERRESFPIPLSTPTDSYPIWGSPGWETAFEELRPHYDDKSATWALRLGYEWWQVAKTPPASLSPVYFRSIDETGAYGEIEYLADDGQRVTPLRIHGVLRIRRALGRMRHSDYPPTAPKNDWAMLTHFFREGFGIEDKTVKSLTSAIKKECSWLLDPGWQYTDSGPTLIRSRVSKILAGLPELDAEKAYRWMTLMI